MLNLTLDECETKDWNIPMAGISDRFHFWDTRPIMSRVIQGYPCILVRLNHRDIYGVLMGLTYYAEKWNSDSIEMILDKEATLRLKDLKRDFNSGLFRRHWIPACSMQHISLYKRWRHHDVISKNTGFRHFKIVLSMRFSVMEYCWRWISHPDVRNSNSRQIISRFMELAKGDDPAWNSFGLEFQDGVPIFEIMFFAVFWNISNL